MKLTDCISALSELDLRPIRSLGQHFLVDSNILDIILSAARLDANDTVLEIGPGLGALTSRLLRRAAKVIAIEKDRRLHDWLRQQFCRAANLELFCGDALEIALPASLKDENFKLVANLPYSVSSALIERFVETPPRPSQMVLTLQREMGERLAARPATKDYGALTLLTQLRYHVRIRHVVSAKCFYPPPEVESAVVVLDRSEPGLELKQGAPFKQVVRAAFSQRRKMLRKMLVQAGFGAQQVQNTFQKLNIAPTVRGEELSLKEFIQLANELL